MTPEATLARLREYMVGPARFMNLLSCFELGIIDTLRENFGMTAAKLGDAVGAKPDAVEQLLHLLIKEDFVAYDEDSGHYSLAALVGVEKDHVGSGDRWQRRVACGTRGDPGRECQHLRARQRPLGCSAA